MSIIEFFAEGTCYDQDAGGMGRSTSVASWKKIAKDAISITYRPGTPSQITEIFRWKIEDGKLTLTDINGTSKTYTRATEETKEKPEAPK